MRLLGAKKYATHTHADRDTHSRTPRQMHAHSHSYKQNLLFVVFTNAPVGAEPAEVAATVGEERSEKREVRSVNEVEHFVQCTQRSCISGFWGARVQQLDSNFKGSRCV